jgi:Fe-S cluster biogenesis protein NfuA
MQFVYLNQAHKMTEDQKITLLERVETAIHSIRPYLEADGGNVTVEDITDDYVAQVRFHGACSSCSMSEMTLRAGVAEAVKQAIPEIKDVVALN